MIDVLKALTAEIVKMFAADLWLTLTALAAVGLTLLAIRTGLIDPAAAPFVLAGGVLVALAVGVARGARR